MENDIPDNYISASNRRLLTIASLLSILTFAIAGNIVSPSLKTISQNFRVDMAGLGVLFFASSLGYVISVLGGGYLGDYRGRRLVVLLGCFIVALGCAGIGSAPALLVVIIFSFLLGAGGGFIELMVSALISDLYPHRRRAALNFSQVMYGIGAVFAPVTVGSLLDAGVSWRASFFVTAIFALGVALVFRRGIFPPPSEIDKVVPKKIIGIILNEPRLPALALGMFLYVGAEIGQASWVPYYFAHNFGTSATLAGLALSLFWGGVMLGRLLTGKLTERISDLSLLIFTSVLTAFFMLGAMLIPRPGWAAVLFLGLGFFCGPIWPTIVSYAGTIKWHYASTALGIIIASGGVGVMTVPPLMGLIAQHFSLRTSFLLPVSFFSINALLFAWLASKRGKR